MDEVQQVCSEEKTGNKDFRELLGVNQSEPIHPGPPPGARGCKTGLAVFINVIGKVCRRFD